MSKQVASRKVLSSSMTKKSIGLQGSLQHGLQLELRPSRRHCCLLPLPARDERGGGWGEGLSHWSASGGLPVNKSCSWCRLHPRSALRVAVYSEEVLNAGGHRTAGV